MVDCKTIGVALGQCPVPYFLPYPVPQPHRVIKLHGMAGLYGRVGMDINMMDDMPEIAYYPEELEITKEVLDLHVPIIHHDIPKYKKRRGGRKTPRNKFNGF